MTEPRFNARRLRALLESYLADHATLAFSRDGLVTWIFPDYQGTPIQLRLEEDMCLVIAGFSFGATIAAGDSGSEWMIFDCIEAIIEGKASEYYDFTSNYLDGARNDGVTGEAFAGRNMGTESGKATSRFVHRIPAWKTIPPRPVGTTADVLWGHK